MFSVKVKDDFEELKSKVRNISEKLDALTTSITKDEGQCKGIKFFLFRCLNIMVANLMESPWQDRQIFDNYRFL